MHARQKTRRPLRRKSRASRRTRKAKTAAIVVQTPNIKPWLLSPEEVTILKNAVCKGATDDELKYCLAVARRYELDPFQQQIWFVPRWDSKAQASDGTEGSKVWVPVVGIGGLLHIAGRDHADFGTFSEVEYGPMIEVTWGGKYKFKAPEWARIEAWKKGDPHPTVAKVWWEEIYPDVDRAPLVRRMPRLMLGKCAKAQACRTSYPKTGGLLIPEETHTREFQNITPGGRVFGVKSDVPQIPSESSIAAYDAASPYLKSFEEKEKEQLAALKNEKDTRPSGTRVEAAPVAPAPTPTPKPAAPRDAKQHGAKPEPRKPPRAEIPGDLHTINGKLKEVVRGVAQNKSNFRRVVLSETKFVRGPVTYFCFDNKERMIDGDTKDSTFSLLDQAKPGVPISFLCRNRTINDKPMPELVTLLKISNLEWENDGTPVIQRGLPMREPGE